MFVKFQNIFQCEFVKPKDSAEKKGERKNLKKGGLNLSENESLM